MEMDLDHLNICLCKVCDCKQLKVKYNELQIKYNELHEKYNELHEKIEKYDKCDTCESFQQDMIRCRRCNYILCYRCYDKEYNYGSLCKHLQG